MKTALISGVAGGMGRATCEKLKSEGYRVIGLDVAEPIDASYDFRRADLTDKGSVRKVYESLSAEGVKLDCIVNMAGIYDLNSLVEIPEEEFIRIFNVNLFGVYRMNKTFLPLLKEGGRIIIVSSELAPLDPLPFTGLYGVTKSALEKYAYSLRMELQLLGYSVSVIRPGAVDTGLLEVSTARLEDFTENTDLYSYNADRFKRIVDRAEAKKVKPDAVAKKVSRALSAKRAKYVYNLNRNPLLRLLNALPDRWQNGIIKTILTK
ncbi:MAG: SDR family NAD(P)-dependent oxidoreductase [Clostridia bacterium]|nr:SDR family NAD(P)-dependent oxidoreductase [Clostridia bacterium]